MSLQESTSSDRSNAVPFPSKAIYESTDIVYVFAQDDSDIDRVEFFIDGALHKQENYGPWDLEGGAVDEADPFYMSSLSVGTHVLRVEITKESDGSIESDEFTFHIEQEGEPTEPDFDLRAFLEAEIASGKKDIVVPPGVYRVTPKNREHLKFSNLQDVTIHAEGVEMICTETTRAITISH